MSMTARQDSDGCVIGAGDRRRNRIRRRNEIELQKLAHIGSAISREKRTGGAMADGEDGPLGQLFACGRNGCRTSTLAIERVVCLQGGTHWRCRG